MSNSSNENPMRVTPLPLQHEWCFWLEKYNPTLPNHSYSTNLTLICTVKTVQEFWSAYNNIISPEHLQNRNSIHFFKKGVKPIWEDPKNENGGSWSYRMPKDQSVKIWPELLMLCVGRILDEAFTQGDSLIGVSISSRWNLDIIQIWNFSSGLAATAKVEKTLQNLVEGVELQQPYYKAHSEHSDFKKGA
ncbi:translation initiation factor eIF4e [Neoconidiobolus thromboides FSU 785]|nr:translation initiation factor eIF4e [Neoconidiobolus thromboides FSU 785]